MPGIKPIGKTHRKVESRYVRVSICAEDACDKDGGLKGEETPEWCLFLTLGWVFRNKGYNWLWYHLDGIFEPNWLVSSYLT